MGTMCPMDVPPKDPDLLRVAVETERYVARDGWDQPARLFALVATHELARSAPGLQVAGTGPEHLSAVEQEGFDIGADLQGALAGIMWPAAVRGCALVLERIVVPPQAEHDLPEDPDQAMAVLAAHPQRQDVRLLAAVERAGASICLLRQRAHDADDMVATGSDIATGLVAALAATLDDEPEAPGHRH